MDYQLMKAETRENKLFFRLDGEEAGRHGAIGHLRGDFDTGKLFYTTWFDNQKHLKSEAFKAEFDKIVNFLRNNPENPVLKSRADMREYCRDHPEQHIDGGWHDTMAGFKIQTDAYSCYVRCAPHEGDYDLYIFCFDNRYLLPELAGQHELPEFCYSTLPDTGAVIIIKQGESGYYPCDYTTNDRQKNRETADLINERLEITKAQEKAMRTGSMFGWAVPGAKPWNYEQNGKLRLPNQPKKNDPER